MARIIAVMSGKGGVGKTVCSLNIALALHQFGERVVVVDGDITASNMGFHLGYYSFPNSIQRVISGEAEIEDAIHSHITGLNFIPSSISLSDISVKPRNFRQMLASLPYDFVIVDAPPGLDEVAKEVLDACDEVLIITNPEMPAIANAVKVIRMAEEKRKKVIGIVLNRYTGSAHELRPDEVEMVCEVPVIGVIPEHEDVRRSIAEKTPVVALRPHSDVSIAFKKVAARLVGKVYEPPRFLGIRRLLGLI